MERGSEMQFKEMAWLESAFCLLVWVIKADYPEESGVGRLGEQL